MQFASLEFALFFAIVFTLRWLFSKKRRPRNIILLLASYYFYYRIDSMMDDGRAEICLALLLLSTVANYICGNAMIAGKTAQKRMAFGLGIGFNLGLLCLFKYYRFGAEQIEMIAYFIGSEATLERLPNTIPIGISFYTFQALTYLVDLRRGHGVRAQSFLDFALYQVENKKRECRPIGLPQQHRRCH